VADVGETDLDVLLESMRPELREGVFVFATVDTAFDHSQVKAQMVFREAEGVTLILAQAAAEEQGIAYEFPSRMITLNIHSSLEAVGFMARITTLLAKRGISVNPVSGFYHDHLFVPVDRADDAIRILLGDLKIERTGAP